MATAHAAVPTTTSAHMVGTMTGNSTSAPKMHIDAAPASRKAPGSSSHAAYQGGCTPSPRSKRRAAKNRIAAAAMAGAASCAAHAGPTDPRGGAENRLHTRERECGRHGKAEQAQQPAGVGQELR